MDHPDRFVFFECLTSNIFTVSPNMFLNRKLVVYEIYF